MMNLELINKHQLIHLRKRGLQKVVWFSKPIYPCFTLFPNSHAPQKHNAINPMRHETSHKVSEKTTIIPFTNYRSSSLGSTSTTSTKRRVQSLPMQQARSTNPFDDASTRGTAANGSMNMRSHNPFEEEDRTTTAAAPPIIFSTSTGVELHAATGGFASHSHSHYRKNEYGNSKIGSMNALKKASSRLGGRDQHLKSGSSSYYGGSSLLDSEENNWNSIGGSVGVSGSRSNSYSLGPKERGIQSSGTSPIWISRNVEWPVPHTLAQSLLLTCADGTFTGNGGCDAGEFSGTPSLGVGNGDTASSNPDETSAATGGAGSYITGLFSRVLPTNTTSASNQTQGNSNSSGTTSNWRSGNNKRILSPSKHCVASSNGWIVAAVEVSPSHDMSDTVDNVKLISRWNVRRGTTHAEETIVPLPMSKSNSKSSDVIKSVFIDPTGCHVLVSTSSGVAFHLHSSSTKARKLQGFSNIGGYITSVAWDHENGTEGSTKNILLGTSNGKIYQVTLLGPNSEHNSDEMPMLLHKLDCDEKGDYSLVSGLYFQRVAGGRPFIIAVTSGIGKRTRIHRFRGHDTVLRSAFDRIESNNTESGVTQPHSSFVELPGSIDFADLCVCKSSFALRSDAGIYYGVISNDDGGGIQDSGILPYDGNDVPSSIAITPHHYISLNDDGEILFISRISLKVIQREIAITSFNGSQEGGELLTDVRRPDQVWLRQGRTLLHISSPMEDRDVWSLTLEKCIKQNKLNSSHVDSLPGYQNSATSSEAKVEDSEFDAARLTCTNTAQEAVVATVRGEYHLSRGRPEMAAKYLASSPPVLAPFGRTTLRLCLPSLHISDNSQLINADKSQNVLAQSNNALIIYLSEKLRVASELNDTVTCAMLGAWICELYLYEKEKTPQDNQVKAHTKLSNFLMKYARYLDPTSTIRILSSHDATAIECAEYAAASGDVGTAINAVLGDNKKVGALKALKILAYSPFEKAEPYYYRHALKVIERAPLEASTNFLSRFNDGLQPTKVLSAFMDYERKREIKVEKKRQARRRAFEKGPLSFGESKESEMIRNSFDDSDDETGVDVSYFEDNSEATVKYLDGVIQLGCKSTAVFSYLISILVSKEDEEQLFRFISKQLSLYKSESQVNGSPPIDLHFVLRAVLKSGRHFRSTVRIYMGLGMRQQAVELALKVDPSLARELARESTEESERKQLWLMIAKNAALDDHGGRDTVAKVLAIIKECGQDTLSIEDVLPFLPDTAQIDQFREEICEALTSYSSKIDQLLQEMSECDQVCESLRADIANLGKLGTKMKSDTRCAFTGKLVLDANEPFYVFPSGYVVLESILKAEVIPFLNDIQKARVKEIEKEMNHLRRDTPIDSRHHRSKEESLQSELDGLIAAECPLTGRIMVESIDKRFPGMNKGML